jgi:branched-chain amino acid transport system permease protein
VLNRLPRAVRWVLAAALCALAALLPWLTGPYLLRVATLVCVMTSFAVGLNLILGYAGMLSFGHAAFFGIGAYVTARLLKDTGLPLPLIMLAAAALAGAAGLVVGLTTWRVRGDYLALVTLGFGEIAFLVMNNWTEVTGGATGITAIPVPTFLGFELRTSEQLYLFTLVVTALLVLVVRMLATSFVGRALLAIREDEIVARAHGINVPFAKVTCFAAGSAVAGVAGVLQALFLAFVGPESFRLDQSVLAVEIVIIGGMATTAGPIIGAIVLIGATEYLRAIANYRLLVFGLLLLVVLLVRPDGLAGILGLDGRRRAPVRPEDVEVGAADATPAPVKANP